MHFVMRQPMSWISRTGRTRYLLKTKTEFAVKPINGNWRPIVRKQLADSSASTFALGTDQHRSIFLHGGRDFSTTYAPCELRPQLIRSVP